MSDNKDTPVKIHMGEKSCVFELNCHEMTEEDWDKFNNLMVKLQDALVEEQIKIAKELNISNRCAMDIQYLRTRSRWTQEKENQLIKMDQAGETLPNVMAGEF